MNKEGEKAYKRRFMQSMQDKGIDALICPAFPVPAWHLKDTALSAGFGTYALIYNIINVPCGVVPVTRISADDVKKMESYPRSNLTDKFVHRLSKGSESLPVAVQAVSFPFQEEVTLRVMKDIESGLHRLGNV